MALRRALLALALLPGAAAQRAGVARACTVAPSVRITNHGTQVIREIYVSSPSRGPNQLGPAGLAPGQSASITLPSCSGNYGLRAVLADGRIVERSELPGSSVVELQLP